MNTGVFCGVVVKVRGHFAWVKELLEHWRESPITKHVWGVSRAWHVSWWEKFTLSVDGH